MQILQDGDIILNVNRGGGEGGIDPDAQTIINNMPAVPTTQEQNAINAFVSREKSAGNWNSYDEIQLFNLAGLNAGHGWLGFASATPQAGVIQTRDGWETSSPTNYINSGVFYNNLVKFTQNDNNVTVYAEQFNDLGAAGQIINMNPSGTTFDLFASAGNINGRNFNSTPFGNAVALPFPAGVLMSNRTANNAATIEYNNLSVSSTGLTATPTSDAELTLGLRLGSNDQPFEGLYKFLSIGSSFPQLGKHKLNVDLLIKELNDAPFTLVTSGSGWTITGARSGVFNVPTGTSFERLQINGLTVGQQYQFIFNVSGNVSVNFRFRPGGSTAAHDIILDTVGQKNQIRTIQDGGQVRFIFTNTTGITQSIIDNLFIYPVL